VKYEVMVVSKPMFNVKGMGFETKEKAIEYTKHLELCDLIELNTSIKDTDAVARFVMENTQEILSILDIPTAKMSISPYEDIYSLAFKLHLQEYYSNDIGVDKVDTELIEKKVQYYADKAQKKLYPDVNVVI